MGTIRDFLFTALAAVLSCMLVIACATSPKGRKQLVLMPEDQMSTMGVQAFTDMKKQIPTETDPRINAYVRCVAEPLTAQVKDISPKGGWEIVVFKDESANAFALPGGKIGVHTGLLKVAQTPAQLAAVIGHEIGHVIARHGNERVSETVVAQLGLAGVGLAMSEKNQNYGLVMGALGLGAQFGVLLPHGRTQESEADLIGLDLMAKAGFDPRESVALWKNMGAKAGGGQPPEFMSTHPSHGTRIANLERNIPGVMPAYESAPTHPHCSPVSTSANQLSGR